jgi:flagellar motor switch protein FliM
MSTPNPNQTARTPDPLFDRSGAAIERLPGLRPVFETVAAAIGGELASLCRFKSVSAADEITKSSTEELSTQNERSLAVVMQCKKTDARAFLIIDREFVDFLAHRAYGGADDVSPIQALQGLEYVFTSIERGLVRRLGVVAAESLGLAVREAVDAEYCVDRIEQIVDARTFGKRDVYTIEAALRFQGASFSTKCTLALTQNLVQLGRQKFSEKPTEDAPSSDPKWLKDLQVGLATTPVLLTGVLEELDVTLGDLASLRVGGVLELAGMGMGKILLEASGQKLFWCKVGQVEGKYVLEVEERYQEDDSEFVLPSAM